MQIPDMQSNIQERIIAPTVSPQPIFYLKDHLGNTRVTFRADVCDGVPVKYYIDHAIDYYPYGKTLREYYPLQKERYLTTQHERGAETTYDNRGARLYDADVMRFLSVDPLAADYAGWSPYNYVLGNPMRMVDPDGRKADDIIIQNRVDGKIQQVKWTNGGELYDLTNGGFYKGNDNFICEVANDLSQLYQGGDAEIQSRIDLLDDRSNKHFIQSSGGQGASNIPYANGPSGTGRTNADNGISTGSVTFYTPFDCTQNGTVPCKPPEVTLTHELLGHGYDNQQATIQKHIIRRLAMALKLLKSRRFK
jgi:RHS repeat-associated protein